MEVWLPDNPARAGLGELPESVEAHLIPRHGALPSEIVYELVGDQIRRHVEGQPLLNAVR